MLTLTEKIASKELKPNRLINEKSPYLLQHAYNPVDWYPWGEEAFRKAKTENKPIFLSIGYSSCHWCHVMAHESFEDGDIAKFLNENFVNIKVDREERPDVDEIYMKAVMSMTGSGGWPMTVFLTPSLEPFFGGTYFPLTPQHGMPSFINVAKGISGSWKTERKKMVESAAQMKNALKEMYDLKKDPNSIVDDSLLVECYNNLTSSFDEGYGGFSGSPKFPTPSNIFFLTRYSKLKGSRLALNMVTKTLDSMMHGGIFDHVGGGFHRYSTDRYWLVPHFEKMLYDNALLSIAYSETFLITKNKEYAQVVSETLSWVLGEMRSPEGGFYSAQDADSPEGEGSYYVWSLEDVRSALGGKITNINAVSKYFSITNEGNFDENKTILTTKTLSTVASEFGLSEAELGRIIQESKRLMLDYRNKRPKPVTDDKILTAWNGLMISALSKAYCIIGDEEYLKAAISATELILTKLATTKEGKLQLSRSFRDGEARGEGVLEDYSFFINGLIDLYEANFEPRYLETANSLCDSMIAKFHDVNGGFFLTDANTKNLIVRAKDAYDGATPSGNSIAALACSRLAEFTSRDYLRNAAKDTFETFWNIMTNQPSSFTEMLVALQFYLAKTKEIVISGNPKTADTKNLLDTLRSEFVPNSIVLLADRRLLELTPLVRDRIPLTGERAKAFICTNFTCKLPATSPDELMAALRE